jgi:drug/metabolite transporter (DMT)-like permease
VLFVGILSVVFLKRRLHRHQWFALTVVVLGVGIVGLSGSLTKKALSQKGDVVGKVKEDAPNEATVAVGIMFILFAQIG